MGRDADEGRGSRWVALAVLAGMTGALAGSVMAEGDSWPGRLEPDPVLRAQDARELAVGVERALAEGDVELARWIMSRLGER